jgi:hypothetical protein
MLNRHELPPLLPLETVQTSALPLIEPDVSGIVSKRLVKRLVRLTFQTDYVSVMAPANASREDCLEKYYKEQVLNTADPLPLTEFGAIKGVLIGIPLGGLCLALAWGITKGVIALINWIRIGMEILPLGSLW